MVQLLQDRLKWTKDQVSEGWNVASIFMWEVGREERKMDSGINLSPKAEVISDIERMA